MINNKQNRSNHLKNIRDFNVSRLLRAENIVYSILKTSCMQNSSLFLVSENCHTDHSAVAAVATKSGLGARRIADVFVSNRCLSAHDL